MSSWQLWPRVIALVPVVALMSACDHGSPTAPAPATPLHPILAVTSLSVRAERTGMVGYTYRTVVHLRESAGVAATVASVDLTFLVGPTAVVSSHHDQPISNNAGVCPASGAVDTKELTTVDSDAAHPHAATVQARVTYTDGTTWVATASGAADVPPFDEPPGPQMFALTGVITDAGTHAAIAGARLEVLTGMNAGKAASTDDAGLYVLRDLTADTFRLRASADGYDRGEQNVTVPANPRADFELRRALTSPCVYTASPDSLIGIPRRGGQEVITIARTSGGCSWQATSSVDWITFLGATSGNGAAALTVVIAPSADSQVNRQGLVTVQWNGGSTQVKVIQYFCEPATLPATIAFRADGLDTQYGQPTVYVPVWATNPVFCGWSVTANASWIQLLRFNETFGVSVQPNLAVQSRSAGVTVHWGGGGAEIQVYQSRAASPAQPAAANGPRTPRGDK